jgi:hypothetical protein
MLVLLICGFMNYAVEMGSGAVIYSVSFMKIASRIQKFIYGTHRNRAWKLHKLIFFQNEGSSLKNC